MMPGKSCTISVTFTPVAIGTRLGKISITANTATTPPSINLTGTGTGATTTTSLSSSLNSSVYGQSVSFTAKVLPSIAGTPTGTVTFYDGAAVLGTKTVSIAGIAVLTTSSLAGGSHSVTASYSGNSLFAGSTSAAVNQAVTQAKAAVSVSSSLNPAYVGQTVTLRANVSGQHGGVPSGYVTFKQGTTILATVALVGGQATYMHVFGKAGTFSVTAVYGGDVNFTLKTSTALKQVVNRYTTNTLLQSTPNPSALGQAVTFTATVTSTGPQPTGSVTFKNGTTSTTLGTTSLVGGVATLRKSNLPVGTQSITAAYNGN